MRMQDAQVPAGAFGRPNCSGGSDTISSSISVPLWRYYTLINVMRRLFKPENSLVADIASPPPPHS